MNISHFFDRTISCKEFFTKETMDSELVKVPFHELKGVELLGNIGVDNYFYIKKDDLNFFNSTKKITNSIHNWSAEPLVMTPTY